MQPDFQHASEPASGTEHCTALRHKKAPVQVGVQKLLLIYTYSTLFQKTMGRLYLYDAFGRVFIIISKY